MAQQRMLLFRYCFTTKAIYALRTIPRDLSESFTKRFIELQKLIIQSMVLQEVNDTFMLQAAMPIESGGLGFLNYTDVHSIAHIASFLNSALFRETFRDDEGQLNDEVLSNPNHGSFLKSIFDNLHSLTIYLDLPAQSPINQILDALNKLKVKSIKDRCTFQSALYLTKTTKRHAELIDTLKREDPSLLRLASYLNILNESSGMWLRAQCKNEYYRLSNEEFCISLCLRYHLKIPLIHDMAHCPCCSNAQDQQRQCKPDLYGHHFISACLKDITTAQGYGQAAQPHAIHDAIKLELKLIASHAQSPCILEPQDLLHNPDAATQIRPDMVMDIAASNMTHKKYAIDVSIVCPFDGSKSGKLQITRTDDNMPKYNANAENKASTKNNKYKKLCDDRGIVFIPFIIYSTGKIHNDGLKLLQKLATTPKVSHTRGNDKRNSLRNFDEILHEKTKYCPN